MNWTTSRRTITLPNRKTMSSLLGPFRILSLWPGGAFYAFPNISAHLSSVGGKPALAKTCAEISKMLLDKAHVAVVPGEAFGAPGYLRLSYATSIERIDEGLRRLERFFSRAEAAS